MEEIWGLQIFPCLYIIYQFVGYTLEFGLQVTLLLVA